MGFKSLIYKIYYSPKYQDDISIKKTKFNIFIFSILFIIFQIIFIIVTNKDSNNRLIFVESKIENDLNIPPFFILSNISSFSYNILNINDIDTNEINYENGCEFNYLNGESSCSASSPYYKITDSGGVFYPYYKSSNITFQKTYFRVISNILKIPNLDENLASISFKDNVLPTSFISPPAKVEYLLKKEVYIDRYGNENINFIPVLVTSQFLLDICNNLTKSNQVIDECYTIDLSILYQSNVVLYYSEETNRQLVTRILADVSSISRLIIYLVFVVLTYIINGFLFNQKSAWFPNYIRDAIIYHYKYYRVQPNLKKLHKQSSSSSTLSLISNIISIFYNNDDQDESYKIKKSTQGSKNKFKRIFQDIEPQDEESKDLLNVSKLNLLIFISIMVFISFIILFSNYSSRIAIVEFENQDLIELPKLEFSFIGDQFYWNTITEILPNGESKECNFEYHQDGGPPESLELDSIFCEVTGNLSDSSSSITSNRSIEIDKDTIFMNRNEIYQFNVDFVSNFKMNQKSKINNILIKLSINDIDYLITPFSNITVLLEKRVIHKSDGITNIIMYDTNLIISQKENKLFNETESEFVIAGNSYLNIQYQDHQIKHIYEESHFQFGQRILKYILAFSSPLSIIIGFIFTYLVIRLLFKTPSAHCDTKVRESIIYFLNYNKKYPEIFFNK